EHGFNGDSEDREVVKERGIVKDVIGTNPRGESGNVDRLHGGACNQDETDQQFAKPCEAHEYSLSCGLCYRGRTATYFTMMAIAPPGRNLGRAPAHLVCSGDRRWDSDGTTA